MVNFSRRGFILKISSFLLFLNMNKSIANANNKVKKIDCVTPEFFGAKGDGTTDDTKPWLRCIKYAKINKIKKIKLNGRYLISGTLNLFDGLILYGDIGSEIIYRGEPSKQFAILKIYGSNVEISNTKILFESGKKGSVSDISIIGIFFMPSSKNGLVKDCVVDGGLSGRVGNSHCIRLMGTGHSVINCQVLNGGMCITARGDNFRIIKNYITNDYLKNGTHPWERKSCYWDGITMEGVSNSKIINNKIEKCGQSGIYIGGNGFLSHDILIEGNTVCQNWNKGIDLGVSGNVNRNNNVYKIDVINNTVFDNREPQIWLRKSTYCIIKNNKIDITSKYMEYFSGFINEITGISFGHSDLTENNVIENNKITAKLDGAVLISNYNKKNIVKGNIVNGKKG